MSKLISVVFALGFSLQLFAQPGAPTPVSPQQTALEEKVKTLREQLASIQTSLSELPDSVRFTPSLIDSLYAAQRSLEDMTYAIYEKTDYPPIVEEETPVDTSGVPGMEEETPPEPPTSSPNPWGRLRKPKSPRTIFRIGYGFGVTDVADFSTPRQAGWEYPSFDFNESRFSSWQFMLETRLGKRDTTNLFFGGFNPKKPWKRDDQFKENKWSLRWGITLDRHRVSESASHEITTTPTGQVKFQQFEQNTRENRIFVRYITFPVILQYKFGKNVIAQGGVFAGVKTYSEQRVSYGDGGFEVEQRRKNEFGFEKFSYGLSGAVGFDGLFLFGKFNLSQAFKKNDIYDYQLFSYGLTISM